MTLDAAFTGDIELHTRESERLHSYLTGLPSEDWKVPSACDRWEVGDVVAHLIAGTRNRAENIARGLRGEAPTPPPGFDTGPGARPRWEVSAEAAISLRKSLGNQLVPALKDRTEELHLLLAEVRHEDLEKPCWHPMGDMSVGDYAKLAVIEHAIHAWDIRSVLERSYHLSAETLPILTEASSRWWVRIFKPSGRLVGEIRYRFEVSGAVPMRRDIVVEGASCRVEDPGDSDPDVVFRCDTEAFALMAFGRLKRDSAAASGLLSEEEKGEFGVAVQFNQWF